MPLTTLPAKSPRTSRSHRIPAVRPLNRPLNRAADLTPPGVLARYSDHAGRSREILALPGHGGSVLVLDRDAATRGDRRLVAHLAADEPPENASLVCRDYLRDPRSRRCRPLAPKDLLTAPFSEACEPQVDSGESDPRFSPETVELRDRHGARHRLEPFAAGLSIPELRWCRREDATELGLGAGQPATGSMRESVCETGLPASGSLPESVRDGSQPVGDPRPESVRDVIACMEGYEPARALTVRGLARYRDDAAVSVAVLRCELQRIDASRIVLNVGLRRAVLHAMRTQGLSLSEIAYRCGRIKHDGRQLQRRDQLALPPRRHPVGGRSRRRGHAVDPQRGARPDRARGSRHLAPRGRALTAERDGAEGSSPVLVAEHDEPIARQLADQLAADGYRVRLARTTEHARALARASPPELVLLGELETPNAALQLLEEIRGGGVGRRRTAHNLWPEALPVIVIGLHAAEPDLLRAFDAGADDFLARPAGYLELRARLRALLLRAGSRRRARRLLVGPLGIDLDTHEARLHGRSLQLRRLEYELLVHLAREPHRVCAKQELLRAVWGHSVPVSTRTLDSHSSRLRRKLRAEGEEQWVINVRGVGYRLI